MLEQYIPFLLPQARVMRSWLLPSQSACSSVHTEYSCRPAAMWRLWEPRVLRFRASYRCCTLHFWRTTLCNLTISSGFYDLLRAMAFPSFTQKTLWTTLANLGHISVLFPGVTFRLLLIAPPPQKNTSKFNRMSKSWIWNMSQGGDIIGFCLEKHWAFWFSCVPLLQYSQRKPWWGAIIYLIVPRRPGVGNTVLTITFPSGALIGESAGKIWHDQVHR